TKKGTVSVTYLWLGRNDFFIFVYAEPGTTGIYTLSLHDALPIYYGTQATTTGSEWTSPVWEEGNQYVVFRGVGISGSDRSATIISHPGAYGLAVINGMQVVRQNGSN